MLYRTLGWTGEQLPALGLGCMGMSFAYGPTNEAESLTVLQRALELGINFWDTADIYGFGHNEELLSRVLQKERKRVFLATKFGFRQKEGVQQYAGSASTIFDASPAYMKKAVEQSLRRLKTDYIDLYYAHRIDPKVPVEEMTGAMARLVEEGKVRYLGLSEAAAVTIRKAHAVHPIAALQSEYSLLSRDPEKEILPCLRELNIALVPFSPLSRGLFSNQSKTGDQLAADDFRRTLPRFGGSYAENNRLLSAAFAQLAADRGASAAQLALAWVLAQGEDIIPIPGTKRVKYLEENIGALDLSLTPNDLAEIDRILQLYPDTGPRYGDAAMKQVNH